ncbi:uncharacterized protein LOC127701340 [Mytilus californianus]|uniref:uncharacterized protein LOC127701340 n=1 Tax=Mytilus californianus TaxID=6549 RepID=UPI0022483662|nr:uncharacterized protein LOC127701340 [Mytilus californianus]
MTSFLIFVISGYFSSILCQDIYLTTNGSYEYTILESLKPSPDNCGEIHFQIRAGKNAFIALLSGNDDSDPLYEIAFGINDVCSTIRKGKGGLNTTGALDANDVFLAQYEWKNFTIRWNNGFIYAKTPYISMTLNDESPLLVKKIAVTTADDASGDWHFNTEVSIPNGCNITVQQTTTSVGDSTQENQVCMCPCSRVSNSKWLYLKNLNLTLDEIRVILSDELEDLRKNLTIDKTNTSAYLRTKISAPDNRPSAKSMGAVGGLFLVTIVVLIFGSDTINLFKTALFKR